MKTMRTPNIALFLPILTGSISIILILLALFFGKNITSGSETALVNFSSSTAMPLAFLLLLIGISIGAYSPTRNEFKSKLTPLNFNILLFIMLVLFLALQFLRQLI